MTKLPPLNEAGPFDEKIDEKEEGQNEIQEKGFLARSSSFFLEVIKIVVLAGVTIALVRSFLFSPFAVIGQSMEPTFYEKDYLIVDEISYRFRDPKRGEVVVFRSPVSSDFYLKRIIGLPGERIKISDNKVVIYNDEYPQGDVINEVYLDENTSGQDTITLGPNQYYVMGDNRDASYDSRRFGPVDKESIVGRVWVRGWPFSRISTFNTPDLGL